MKNSIEAFPLKINASFSVLVIAEDPSLIAPKLEGMFKHIYLSQTQHQSLSCFYDNIIDLIIIDIDATAYDWRDLVNQFRAKINDITIALLVDRSQPYDLNAIITAGVTHCFFKPLESKSLKLSLYDLINKIQHTKDLRSNSYIQERQRINHIALKTIQHVIEKIPAPLFAYNAHEKVLFYNQSLATLFSSKKLTVPESIHLWNIEDLFDNMTKELHFVTIREGKSFDLKYYYKDFGVRKVFIPTKFSVTLETEGTPFVMVVLTDIEPLLAQMKMLTYQKQKMNSYKELIEELLAPPTGKDLSNKTMNEKHTATTRKKISAKEYVTTIKTHAYETMQELYTIESKLQMAIDTFHQNPTKAVLFNIAFYIENYGKNVKQLIEFSDLGNALCSLSNFIYHLHKSDIAQNISICIELFQNLIETLMQWRISLFETQETDDIHSLDSTILKSVLHFETTLST